MFLPLEGSFPEKFFENSGKVSFFDNFFDMLELSQIPVFLYPVMCKKITACMPTNSNGKLLILA
jgi:hypothetical protein